MTMSSMDPVPLELQVQIRVGKPTGPPMLERHDLARSRGEFAADLAAPRPVFEGPPFSQAALGTGAMCFQVS